MRCFEFETSFQIQKHKVIVVLFKVFINFYRSEIKIAMKNCFPSKNIDGIIQDSNDIFFVCHYY